MSPLRFITLLFACGIVLAKWLQISPLVIPFICVSGFLGIFIFIALSVLMPDRFISLHRLRKSCMLYVVSLLAGGGMYYTHVHQFPAAVSRVAPYDAPVAIAGEITSVSEKDTFAEVYLNAHRVYSDSLNTRVKGALLVQTQGSFTPGMHVLFNGRLKKTPVKRNPGDFDYGAYLAQSQIHAILDANQWIEIKTQSISPSKLRRYLFNARQQIHIWIRNAIPKEDTQALLHALILGDQSHLSTTTLSSFRNAGISHLLAVSGLHVLCVGLILYGLLRPLCLRATLHWHAMEVIRIIATLLLMCSYLCLTDFKPAVFRATVMTSVFIIAPLFQRPVSPINNLFIAAFVLLTINPEYLFHPGFQLSFGAVTGIIYVFPKLPVPNIASPKWGPAIRYILSSVYVSLAALIGTLPVSLFHFSSLSAGGLFLNIAAIPATTGVLISGFLMLISTPFSPYVAGIFGASADVFAQSLFFIADSGAMYFPAISLTHWIPLKQFCLFAGPVFFLVSAFELRLRWSTLCFMLSAVLVFQWGSILKGEHHPPLHVLFFDVGHGDAALVTFPNGRHMLIDTGDTPWKAEFNILSKHVERYAISCIDAVVLTHPDQDHTGGLQTFSQQHCVDSIYTSGDHRFSNRLLTSHRAKTLTAGDTIALDERVVVRVLSPPHALINQKSSNDGSIVLLIEYGATRFLFLGDAEENAEVHLVKHYADLLPSQVIKVGHHGSRTSSSPALVHHAAAGTASLAVISTGHRSRYGLPDEEVVDRWSNAGVQVHNTATSGALWIWSNGRVIKDRIP